MRNEILSYHEMVGREGRSLQAGMSFHVRPGYSILLMSTRSNAPYRDRWDTKRGLLVYEGHDLPQHRGAPDVKTLDQPLAHASGTPTVNGRFLEAARRAGSGDVAAEAVQVYEKLDRGVWSDKGLFHLVDGEYVERDGRHVVELLLRPIDGDEGEVGESGGEWPHTRVIPTQVKVEVWKRDRGQCVKCGATENLHYDHDLPFSKGGSSLTAANVRILCAKHNLEKSDRIE